MCNEIMENKKFNSDLKTIIKKNLENKLQKTLTKGMIVISLMGLTSLSGCRSYLHNCSAYTFYLNSCPVYFNNNGNISSKTDTIYTAMNPNKEVYKINTDERGYN
ncbi:MAG: hypothetical protein AABX80_01090 [Nanoarchaeota archaeon]